MTDLSHLSSQAGAETLLPNAERILRIRAERWINYGRAEMALARMAELLEYPQRDRMPCLLLFGATGMGKTKILRKFLRDHPPIFDDRMGVTRSHVVSMQMPPDPDEKAFYEELLGTLQAPVRFSMTTHCLRRVARELLGFVGTRMIIIDEVHALLAGSYRQQRILLNTLRFVATDLRIPLVCAGTADAKRALTTDQQLADRFEAIELPHWHNDESFHRLLVSFQSVLPLKKCSDLVSPVMRRLLLERTDGVLVRLVRLIEMLAVEAIRSGNERVDQSSLLHIPTPLCFRWPSIWMPLSRKLPVVFRPHAGEVLSSWIVRIAGVYHLDARALIEHLNWPTDALTEIDLSPPEQIVREFSELTRLGQDAVERHTILGANPGWLPDWVTLQTPGWNTTDCKPVFPSGVLFNICPACLHADLNNGGQFIRVNWLCAATTICEKHFIPLRECCESADPPFECRHGPAGSRFFYRATSSVLDFPLYDQPADRMLVALSEFEHMVKLALTARDRLSETPSEATAAEELISVLEDLIWALLQVVGVNGTRVAHCFQTEAFPVPRGWRNPCPMETLSRADVDLRRAILAVAACLLLPYQFAELARTASYLISPSRYSELLRRLGSTRADLLLSRAHRWPRAFRETMEQAA